MSVWDDFDERAPTVLISGANRGIGLGMARLYAQKGWTVLAGAREPEKADELFDIDGEVTILPLDVADPASVAIIAQRLSSVPLDIVIANAGLGGPKGSDFGTLDYDAWMQVLKVNTLGPIRLAEAFHEHLKAGNNPKFIAITSIMGSIASNKSGGHIIYRSSKAGLNAAMVSLAMRLEGDGITTAMFHPGWVRTDMGGPSASISVDESVNGLYAAIRDLDLEDSGAFLDYQGERLPW